ncbi:MAG: gephyrin-like molybdotransferase Glp [Pseudomonadota bacterium]
MTWQRFTMVDWSGGGPGPARPKKRPSDKIYMASVDGGQADPPRYIPDRVAAEEALAARISAALDAGERLFIGFDFPFGYPQGFAKAITGQSDPFALWAEIAARLPASRHSRERIDVAAGFNAHFPGEGPFWFDPFGKGTVPMKKPARFPVQEWRKAESQTKGAFSCWQLGGAGSVGSQALTGIATLERLRQRFSGKIAVWPFEPLEAPIAFVEVWPSLIAPEVAARQWPDEPKDAAQVRVLADAVSRLAPDELEAMLDISAPEEGWIFGLGHEPALKAAARQKRLANECFALPAGERRATVDEALALLKTRLSPLTETLEMPLREAAGRVLAQDITALRPHPSATNAAVDGYAIEGRLGAGVHRIALAQGRAAAGAPSPNPIPKGHALRVLTGAELPPGARSVILEEACRIEDRHISFEGPIPDGANIRWQGEDIEEGAVALSAGRVLTPADLAFAASIGCDQLRVRERLKVAVLSTGDELCEAGEPVGPGQISDANRPMLLATLRRLGHEAIDFGICGDDRQTLRATFDRAAQAADVLITSGGASAGDEDHVSALLKETKAMALWRLALKPGRPLALGIWKDMPIFGLPGNPAAALVCTLILARPALARLSGATLPEPTAFELPAAFSKQKKAGRREYLRARLREGAVEVFASEGSARISGLSWADGLVDLPDEAMNITPGTRVRYLPFDGLFS